MGGNDGKRCRVPDLKTVTKVRRLSFCFSLCLIGLTPCL